MTAKLIGKMFYLMCLSSILIIVYASTPLPARMVEVSKKASNIVSQIVAQESRRPPCLDQAPVVAVFMIKDEAHVIEKTLEPYVNGGINHFYIFDTGSTDTTIETVKNYFSRKGIEHAYIGQEPFVDFATSRNKGLELAHKQFPNAYFLLMPDAEWYLEHVDALIAFCKKVAHEKPHSYLVRIGNDYINFYTSRLIRNDGKSRFIGVVHEDLENQREEDKAPYEVFFKWDPSGRGIEKTEKRWKRDLQLLLKEHTRDPQNSRTVFYLAQTYDCLHDEETALQYYKMRARMPGGLEENYMSLYRIGQMYERLAEKFKKNDSAKAGEFWAQALDFYNKAHQNRPERAEPIISIANHYVAEKNWVLAYRYALWASQIPYPVNDTLFVEDAGYNFLRHAILSETAGTMKDCKTGLEHTEFLLSHNFTSFEGGDHKRSIEHNLAAYKHCLLDQSMTQPINAQPINTVITKAHASRLNENGVSPETVVDFASQQKIMTGLAYGAQRATLQTAYHSEIDPKNYWSPQFGSTQALATEAPAVQEQKTQKIKQDVQKPQLIGRKTLQKVDQPKLLIMLETDDASESLFASLDKWYEKLSPHGEWRILLVTQNPDPAFEDQDFLDRLKGYRHLHTFLSAPYNTVNFEDKYSDIMIMANVNQVIETQNFDEIICKGFRHMFPDYDGFIYFDDQPTHEIGHVIPVVGKMYYHMCGNECLSTTAQHQRSELEPLRTAELHYPADIFEDHRFYAPLPENDKDAFDFMETFEDEKPIVFIVPSYNNINWYQKNLDSMLSQKYKNFRIIYIDDASIDGTTAAVETYLQTKDTAHRVTLIKNQERIGALANIYNAIQTCKPEEIIAIVDGDDWLPTDKVLIRLNSEYHDPDVWMTYGQFRWWPGNKLGFGQELPYEWIEDNTIRDNQWSTTHLRTFYAWLGQHVQKESLLWKKDEFYPMAGDLALMFSVAELAGQHSRFIPEVLYTYNFATPLNDQKINRNFQIKLEDHIRKHQQKYEPLEEAPELVMQSGTSVNNGSKKIVIIDKNGSSNNEVHNRLKAMLQEKNYALEIVKSVNDVHNASLIVVYDMAMKEKNSLMRFPREKLALFMWQSPVMNPYIYDMQYLKNFSQIYTMQSDLVDTKKIFQLANPAFNATNISGNTEIADHKKLCTLVWPYKDITWSDIELYSELRRAVDFFDQQCPNEFELYDKTWEQFGYQSFKGPVIDPIAIMKGFKFCVCFEDGRTENFMSNKLFEAFAAGCVPIYAGAPNIEKYIPKSCFIDVNDFSSKDEKTGQITIHYDELYHFISSMSKETYENYQHNIRAFLASNQAHNFSVDAFIAQFEGMVASLVK